MKSLRKEKDFQGLYMPKIVQAYILDSNIVNKTMP